MCGLLLLLLAREPLRWWLHGEEIYDEQAMVEWIRESHIGFKTLPELVRELVEPAVERTEKLRAEPGKKSPVEAHKLKRAEIEEMLRAMAAPPTKIYPGQLPLFPIIFRLEVGFQDEMHAGFDPRLNFQPIVWDADMPRRQAQYRRLHRFDLAGVPGVYIKADYHLHAFVQKQFDERERTSRKILLNGLGLFFAFLAIVWGYANHLRERRRDQQRLFSEQKVHEAERRHLQEELRRQEAERRHQAVERQNLELKSQMLANISITAGSYAHNIKNLLVRPNDLLSRCLEERPGREEQARMLLEVKSTLGTVTERLQQILQTVRRDPSKSERVRIDLNALVREIFRTWADMARDKWKLVVELDLDEPGKPIWVNGDRSHLEQVLENLLFNARDATFEMRNQLREQARRESGAAAGPLDASRRQALIAAAGWKGRVVLRTRRMPGWAVLEVEDNGIGMTAEVRARCTETYFSTKRNNALFAGMSAGMGVGLSFVTVILDHHQARLEIDSEAQQGSRFRVSFPSAEGLADRESRGCQTLPWAGRPERRKRIVPPASLLLGHERRERIVPRHRLACPGLDRGRRQARGERISRRHGRGHRFAHGFLAGNFLGVRHFGPGLLVLQVQDRAPDKGDAGDEAANVVPVGDAAAMLRMFQRHERRQVLKQEPHTDDHQGRQLDDADPPAEPALDLVERMDGDVGAEHAGYGPRSAQARDHRMRVAGHVCQAADHAAEQVEHDEAPMIEGALDISSKDDQEPHVAEQMHAAAVQEHRRDERQHDRERAGVVVDVDVAFLGMLNAIFVDVVDFLPNAFLLGNVAELGDFPGHEAESVGERLAERDLHAKHEHIDRDQRPGHPGNLAVVMRFVAENQHDRSLCAREDEKRGLAQA